MAKRKVQAETIGYHSQIVVMDLIRRLAPLSRADIARRTGLAVQTVSNIVEVLLKSDLLHEERRRAPGRGQPPLDLRLNPEGRFALGMSLDGRRLTAVLCNLVGDEISALERDIGTMEPDVVLSAIAGAASTLAGEAQVPEGRMLGLGLVMPGLTAQGRFGTLIKDHPWRDRWQGRPFAKELSRLTGLPVMTDNDRTAAALSERLSGRGREAENFLYIYFGSGIGGGFILGGLPFRGRTGRAGEIGHMVVDPGGRACACGNHGCLERYASLQALQSSISGLKYDAEPLDTVLVARAVAEAHPAAQDWLDVATRHLRTAIVSLENVMDLDTIFLGGVIPDAVAEALLERLEALPQSVSSGGERTLPRVLKSEVGRRAAARGGAALVVLSSTVPDFARFDGDNPVPHAREKAQKTLSATR